MDPLSIVCSLGPVIGQTVKVVKLLHELHDTLRDAPLLLSSITSECSIVGTSLGLLQDMQNRKNNRRSLQSTQVFATFDMALASCSLILSVLEKDVKACLKAGKQPGDGDAVRQCQLILSKDHLHELLLQLRGQQQAITLLLSTMQRYPELFALRY